MRLVYEAAVEADRVDALRSDLHAAADSDTPEAALRFLAEIARWEDNAQAALGHLRRLAERAPRDADVRVALADAALDAKQPREAEAALREALEIAPEHRGALTRLAEVLVQRGNTEEAVEVLKRAVNYDPSEPATARSLNHALRRHSLHHERVKIIEEARAATEQPDLMAYELAQAHIDLLRYEDATRELLAALETDGVSARAVGVELERLAADELAGEQVLGAVRRHADEATDLPDAERLALARVFFVAGDHDRARTLLRGAEGAGMAVADMARDASLRGDDGLAASLYEMALGMDLRPAERAEIALGLAGLQRQRAGWRAALQTLEETTALTGHPEALLMRAELLTRRAHRPEEARAAWERLLAVAGADRRYVEAAREGMADWLFATGRLDEAEAAYAELAADEPSSETGPGLGEFPPLPPGLRIPGGLASPSQPEQQASTPARAALRLAEIALRRGEVEEAQERFRLVVSEHAQTAYANDALDRLAFIRDNIDGEGSAERRYFEALALRQSGNSRMARDLLLEIAGTRDEPLADDALMALAELRAEQEDLRSAVETWVSVLERFPESLMAPQALLKAASILRDELDDPVAAAEVLRRIVEDYPDSAAAHQARSDLELLRPSAS
jgi:tetratricopeptide (TPR) repeat protein